MAAPLDTRYPITRSGSTLYVDVYTSHPYDTANSAINRLVIVVHGSSMNPWEYRDRLASRLGPNVLVVAPLFRESAATGTDLYWSSGWREGNRSNASLPFRVSSFEIVDQMRLDLTARFTNIRNVVVGGFSAGGQFTQRYSMTQTGDSRLSFVVGAPSSYAYVNGKRPTTVPSSPPPGYDDWKYGLANIGSAAVSYVDTIGAQTMRDRLQAAKVTYIVGDQDVGDIGGLDTTAQANVQGASGRVERRNNYLTHLADHYGSSILATHLSATVPGAGHDGHYEVFNSTQADTAFLREATPTVTGNNLSRFELQLPTGSPGNVDVIDRDPLVAGYSSAYFTPTGDGQGNRFTCPVNGVTTSGTTFPRTELREVNTDGSNAAWHPSDGKTRTLQTTIRVNHLPDADPEVTLLQLHNEDTEVVALRTARIGAGTIRVAWRLNGSTQTTSTVTQDYQWGTDFTVKVVVAPTTVTVFGNGTQMYQWPVSTLTPGPNNKFYFKAGNYLQANPSTAPATEYGEVEHRNLSLDYDGDTAGGGGGSAAVTPVDSTIRVFDSATATFNALIGDTPANGGPLVEGDVLLFQLGWDDDGPVVTGTPAGVSTVMPHKKAIQTGTPANAMNTAVYLKRVTATEVASQPATWSFPVSPAVDNGQVIVARFRGVHATDPVGVAAGYSDTDYSTSTASKTSPAVTTDVDGGFIVAGVTHRSGSALITPPAGWTVIQNGGGLGGRATGMAHKGVLASAGATPTATWGFSNSGVGSAWMTALRPAATGGGGGGGSGPSVDITLPVYKEMALQLTSTAENSTKDWTTAYRYIEDIGDGRGYTAGIVGWCSGTGDMLTLVQYYTQIAPGNRLAKYVDELTQIMAAPYANRPALSHSLLDPQGFVTDWQWAADNDPNFQRAQRDERDRVYWSPALAQAVADGVGPLGLAIHYDISVNHGPGNDSESYGGILATARAASAPPSQGGSESAYLSALTDAREDVLIGWGDNQPDGRVSMHRGLIASGNLLLNTPFSWSIYGDSFTMAEPPPVTGGTVTYQSAWVGVGTTTSVPVAVNTTTGPVRLKVGTDAAVTQNVTYTASVARGGDGDTQHVVTGLTPGTTYYARVEENGTLVGGVLKFHTAYDTPRSLKLVFGSCTKNTDGSPVMTTMVNSNPDYFWHLGDLYYNDGIAKTKANFRNEFNKKLRNSEHLALMTQVPSMYTPSDHEGLANNTVGTMVPEWAQYLETYREKVPVLPGAYALPSGGIYSAVLVTPRILFVNLDGRTYKSNPAATDNSSKHVWGAAQETWLKNTLDNTTAVYAVIAVPDVGWNGLKVAGEENLSGYRTTVERVAAMLAQWKVATGKVADLIAGDAHFLASNDGSNGSPGGMPLWHAAPFSNLTEGAEELPGAIWTRPPKDERIQQQQYGELVITDTGGTSITRTFRGLLSTGTVKLQPTTVTSTVPGPSEPPPPPPPPGTGGGTLLFDNGLSGPANQPVTLADLNSGTTYDFAAESPASAAVATFTSNGAGVIIQANSGVKWWQANVPVGDGGTRVTYLRITRGSYPAVTWYPIRYTLGGSTVARLSVSSSGVLQVAAAGGNLAVGTVPFPQDREVTLGFRVLASTDAAVGQIEARWWAAPAGDPTANPDITATPGDTVLASGVAVGPGVGSIMFGNTTASNTGTSTFLDFEVYDGWVGAATSAVNAGVDKSARGGDVVTLSAAGTPSGGTYAWARAATPGNAPAITLSGADTATATFTAPNAPGTTANFTVTYTPSGAPVATDTVAVSFTAANKPVVISSRRDQVVLDATPSPGDVRIVQTVGSPVDITESPEDVFVIDTTDTDEDLQFQLITNDGVQDSDPQVVDVTTNGATVRVSAERYWNTATGMWLPTRV